MITQREQLTDREREEMEFQQQMFDRQAEHTQKVKAMELEAAKVGAQWSNILRLPLLLARLPLLVVLGVAYCISVARKHDLPPEFWDSLK